MTARTYHDDGDVGLCDRCGAEFLVTRDHRGPECRTCRRYERHTKAKGREKKKRRR